MTRYPVYVEAVQHLFNLALARLDRAPLKRREFAEEWNSYIAQHPWRAELVEVSSTEFEFHAVMDEPAPPVLSLIFSEWLGMVRASVDNGLYAWAAAVTGQDPPPKASAIQFPIAESLSDFQRQAKRLSHLPNGIVNILERAQPYRSPDGPQSNLLYWINELARTDRHRKPHVGIGRVAQHNIRVGLPEGTRLIFDESVSPFQAIEGSVLLCRFTTTRPVHRSMIVGDFRGVGVDPEISAWADFRLDGRSRPLKDRMRYAELFMRNHIENLAVLAGVEPGGGFTTFDPPRDEQGKPLPAASE